MDRAITVAHLQEAVGTVVFTAGPKTVEPAEPACSWVSLCGQGGCTFPRYSRNGVPVGLVSRTLVQLGYPVDLVLALDREYEMGEVLHPGVKIGRSRNAALARIGPKGMTLLSWLQDNQKAKSYGDLLDEAFGPKKLLRFRDARRRPWRY